MAISKLKSDIRTHINDYKFIIDALKLPQGGKFRVFIHNILKELLRHVQQHI